MVFPTKCAPEGIHLARSSHCSIVHFLLLSFCGLFFRPSLPPTYFSSCSALFWTTVGSVSVTVAIGDPVRGTSTQLSVFNCFFPSAPGNFSSPPPSLTSVPVFHTHHRLNILEICSIFP